jgi:XTP/dITP diphosphohydrolase
LNGAKAFPAGALPVKRLLVATGNAGKVKELRQLLSDTDWQIICLQDLAQLWQTEKLGGLPPAGESPAAGEIRRRYEQLEKEMAETGATFEENAVLKAKGAARFTGLPALADDSGLEVDYLGGGPGVYSARYAGPERDAAACNRLLLENMKGAAAGQRSARFRAAAAFASPQGELYVTSGVCEGSIGFAPQGSDGFGYDPIFVFRGGAGKTLAQLTMAQKNQLSHRGQALKKMLPFLKNYEEPGHESRSADCQRR